MDFIQLPLLEWLRRETCYGQCSIPPEWGDVIVEKTRNSPDSGYYVQFTTHESEGQEYRTCTLWRYPDWKQDNENTERARAWSQKQREERFVFEYNHKVVMRAVKKYFSFEDNIASMVAMKYLRAQNNELLLKEMGIDKESDLAKTIKDLP